MKSYKIEIYTNNNEIIIVKDDLKDILYVYNKKQDYSKYFEQTQEKEAIETFRSFLKNIDINEIRRINFFISYYNVFDNSCIYYQIRLYEGDDDETYIVDIKIHESKKQEVFKDKEKAIIFTRDKIQEILGIKIIECINKKEIIKRIRNIFQNKIITIKNNKNR